VHFEGVLRDRLDDPATALAPVARMLASADLAIVNLETSIGTGGRPEPGKRYPFRAPPRAFAALSAAGIDVATMANNHALDYGRPMLAQTFAAAAAAGEAHPPLAVIGIGSDVDEAFRPAMNDVRGTVIATLGATVADEDPTADPTGHWAATASRAGTADAVDPRRLLQAVGDANRTADVVVVYLHWGIQGERCPSRSQRTLAERLVDRGADLVVGSHTHGLQGDGPLRGGYVAYGLGNFVWYAPSPPTSPTGVLTLTVRPAPAPEGRAEVTKATWEPARISGTGLPRPLRGGQRAFDAELEALRSCAGFPA
jgi:poly-gamma-glutamate synthesis protein (capsule biosynthesis protein)